MEQNMTDIYPGCTSILSVAYGIIDSQPTRNLACGLPELIETLELLEVALGILVDLSNSCSRLIITTLVDQKFDRFVSHKEQKT